MKQIYLLGLLLAVLAACNPSDMGANYAQSLADAWGTDSIKQVAESYYYTRDSVMYPGEGKYLAEAFIDGCAGNDSLQTLARAIALTPSEVGEETAQVLIEILSSDKPDIDRATSHLGMIDHAYILLKRPGDIALCYAAIDEAVKKLPIEKQMSLYTASCTPETLGDALRAERSKDAADADHRATIVMSLLSGDSLEAFKKHYYVK